MESTTQLERRTWGLDFLTCKRGMLMVHPLMCGEGVRICEIPQGGAQQGPGIHAEVQGGLETLAGKALSLPCS